LGTWGRWGRAREGTLSKVHDRFAETLAALKAIKQGGKREPPAWTTYPHMSRTGTARPKAPTKRPFPKGRIVAVYDYCDHVGALLFQVVRFDPKDFRQRVPKPEGGWRWHLGGMPRVLFRLPQVLHTVGQGGLVVVCEGEKDALAVARLGLCTTTCSEGAGAWEQSFSETLVGAGLVAILPDNDQPGRAHAAMVARSLVRHRVAVRVIALPDLPEHGDASDWIAAGGTVVQLLNLIRHTPPWHTPGGTLLDHIAQD